MATLTKSTGTVILKGAVEKVTFPAVYGWVWVKNMSDSDMFVGLSEDISAGADGVLSIPSGDAGRIQTDGQDSVYILGSGNALVVAQNYAECPFKAGAKGGGVDVGGESSYVLKNAVDYPLLGLSLYGKSTQDGVPTPENPVEIVSVGDSGSVSVQACGKNLFDLTAWKNGIVAISHGTIEYNSNGFKLTATTNECFTGPANGTNCEIPVEPNTTYVMSWDADNNNAGSIYVFLNGIIDDRIYGDNYLPIKRTVFTTKSDTTHVRVRFGVTYSGQSITYSNIQIEKGEIATAYEPYKCNIANITTSMPLCGIPVESGGNYTDKDGQQWVCDTLVYNADGSGKIVKRTDKIDSYNGESITTPSISTTGSMTTGATVIYQLAEPQEIELTAAEMTALRQLQTFNGTTSISNDGGADMDITYCTNKTLSEYVMPITTGLQKQIDELKAAVLSLGGNI